FSHQPQGRFAVRRQRAGRGGRGEPRFAIWLPAQCPAESALTRSPRKSRHATWRSHRRHHGVVMTQWQQPRLIEVHYPTTIADVRDRDRWMMVMMLDNRLNARDQIILVRLALHLNLKTGRCDPSVGLLASETSIDGRDAERQARRSLAKGEETRWIRVRVLVGCNTR